MVNPEIAKLATIQTKNTTQDFITQLLQNIYISERSAPEVGGFDVKIFHSVKL